METWNYSLKLERRVLPLELSGCDVSAAEVGVIVGHLNQCVLDGSFVHKKLVLREDHHHVVRAAAHNLLPVVQAGHQYTVAQADAVGTAFYTPLERKAGAPSRVVVGQFVAGEETELRIHRTKTKPLLQR